MATQASDTAAKIQTIIAEQLNVSKDAVKPDSTLESLGADSLDRVEIIMKLEEEFGVEIKDEEAEKLNTVEQVVGYINSLRH